MTSPAPQQRPAEPLAISNLIQLVIATAVTAGWATADDPLLPIIGTIIGGITSAVVLIRARARTIPLSR